MQADCACGGMPHKRHQTTAKNAENSENNTEINRFCVEISKIRRTCANRRENNVRPRYPKARRGAYESNVYCTVHTARCQAIFEIIVNAGVEKIVRVGCGERENPAENGGGTHTNDRLKCILVYYNRFLYQMFCRCTKSAVQPASMSRSAARKSRVYHGSATSRGWSV